MRETGATGWRAIEPTRVALSTGAGGTRPSVEHDEIVDARRSAKTARFEMKPYAILDRLHRTAASSTRFILAKQGKRSLTRAMLPDGHDANEKGRGLRRAPSRRVLK